MRTQLIGLLFLGLTSLTQAQKSIETEVDVKSVNLRDVIITTNSKYMNKVYEKISSEMIKDLQQLVAGFDITKQEFYSPEFDSYLVSFKTNGKTFMNVTYNAAGVVLSSYERYHNILLPLSIRQALVKDYPMWILHENFYRVSYTNENLVNKIYKIQVRKDGEKRNLKINLKDNQAVVMVDHD